MGIFQQVVWHRLKRSSSCTFVRIVVGCVTIADGSQSDVLRVAEFMSSGMLRSEFCQSRGLSFSTLDRHLKKLRWKRRRRSISSALLYAGGVGGQEIAEGSTNRVVGWPWAAQQHAGSSACSSAATAKLASGGTTIARSTARAQEYLTRMLQRTRLGQLSRSCRCEGRFVR
jgi:hypothetical protein